MVNKDIISIENLLIYVILTTQRINSHSASISTLEISFSAHAQHWSLWTLSSVSAVLLLFSWWRLPAQTSCVIILIIISEKYFRHSSNNCVNSVTFSFLIEISNQIWSYILWAQNQYRIWWNVRYVLCVCDVLRTQDVHHIVTIAHILLVIFILFAEAGKVAKWNKINESVIVKWNFLTTVY